MLGLVPDLELLLLELDDDVEELLLPLFEPFLF